MNAAGIKLDAQIKDIEERFEAAHLAYICVTDQRVVNYKRLSRKDQEVTRYIQIKKRSIARVEASILAARSKIGKQKRKNDAQHSCLKAEKDSVACEFRSLKRSMARFRKEHEQRVADLCIDARATKEHYEFALSLAERILGLSAHAKKFESEAERCFMVDETIKALASKEMIGCDLDAPDSNPHPLHLFLKKHNEVSVWSS